MISGRPVRMELRLIIAQDLPGRTLTAWGLSIPDRFVKVGE